MVKVDFEVKKVTEVTTADSIRKGQVELVNKSKLGTSKIQLVMSLDEVQEFTLGQFYRLEFLQVAAPGTIGAKAVDAATENINDMVFAQPLPIED